MECKRCGICCEKGGPILHHEDRSFLQKNLVSLDQLRVIRRGESAFNPFTDRVEPAEVEMIKLAAGTGTSWECPFHQKNGALSGCTIHGDRPMECRVLKCWDTRAIEAVVFKDCLTRSDLLGADNLLLGEILAHEERCAYGAVWLSIEGLKGNSRGVCLAEIQAVLSEDMQIRARLVAQYELTLVQELFYLGQLMFRVVKDSTLTISFNNEEVQVRYTG
ncbi:MAG: YkgJ family cysteine cluster protein [Desulfobulbaceae bacterium]|jgi:Fe-S-cluster containining protein|nr:YkgJ family cysteine cluster protein [Desulfobulbaceae bacterium]